MYSEPHRPSFLELTDHLGGLAIRFEPLDNGTTLMTAVVNGETSQAIGGTQADAYALCNDWLSRHRLTPRKDI